MVVTYVPLAAASGFFLPFFLPLCLHLLHSGDCCLAVHLLVGGCFHGCFFLCYIGAHTWFR